LSPAEGRVRAPRTFGPGKRVLHRPREQGHIVIRALVQARLLGLKLLTLDACVVVASNDGHTAVVPVRLSATGPDVSDRSAVYGLTSPSPESGTTSLAYAMQLLDQGVHTLEHSRRLRLSGARLADWEQDRSSAALGVLVGFARKNRRPGAMTVTSGSGLLGQFFERGVVGSWMIASSPGARRPLRGL